MSAVGTPRTINVIDHPEARCQCVTDHNPNAVQLHVHHIQPLAWGGPDEPDNEILLCPTTHDKVHRALREAVKADTAPKDLPWRLRQPLGSYAIELAQTAWELDGTDR